MNSCDPTARPARAIGDAALDDLLHDVRLRFYGMQPPAAFHRDRRRLLYALTWPATWLERRGLFCSPARYRQLVSDRLDAIMAHGDHTQSGRYFPTYLLKCLQDFFDRHGDDLYGELKHIRNALDVVCGTLRFAEKASAQARQIETLAAAHRLLRAQVPSPSDPRQMALF
jgi:hypothetical protein